MRRWPSCCFLLVGLAGVACSADDNPVGAGAGGAPGAGGATQNGTSGNGGSAQPGTTGGGMVGQGGSSATGGSGGGSSGGSSGSGGATDVDGGRDGGKVWPVGDPGTTGDGNIVLDVYKVQPDLTNQGNPQGTEFHFDMKLADSKIFDGKDTILNPSKPVLATRGIDVYVPAQYKDGTPAPILIIQDGPGPLDLVRNALDNLTISADPTRKIPAFIAIAVAHGGGDGKGSERGLEYDTMSDRYARLIQLEVLPAVLANPAIRAAYPGLAFTDNPEGRATLGCSSGGAAALTMGWFRPDLFRRIITYSGTFVAAQNDTAPEHEMFPHGAWDYHSELKLIANTDIKPLRIFTNVNEDDLHPDNPENTYYNWVMANRRTAAALQAKGYHNRFVFATGSKHCEGRVKSSTLADTLVWTWRGYPAP